MPGEKLNQERGGGNIPIKEHARGKAKSGEGTLIEKHYEQLVHSTVVS
jgi:hypothetical protein